MESTLSDPQFPTLSRAPIAEALVDIATELPGNVTLDELRAFCTDDIRKRFHHIQERIQATSEIKFLGATPPRVTSDAHPDGLLMRSDEEALMVQARLNGFTVNKFAPYVTWSQLKAQALPLWHEYVRIARPSKVTRLAVRYTNHLELPVDRDLKECILTVPEIAPGIPQGLPEFFMRLVIPHESGCAAIVTLSTVHPRSNADIYPIVLDIDAFRYVNLEGTNEEEIWSYLDELRQYKNLIFFKTLTPKFLEKYR